MDTSNLLNKLFKVMIINMLNDEHKENFNKKGRKYKILK